MIQKSWYAGHGLFRYVASAGIMVVIAACGTDSGPGQLSEAANAPDQPTNKSSTSMPKDLRAAYITSVQKEASESYAAVAMDGLVQFENPAQRFVATIDRNGLSVVPNEETWHLGMRTLALGCEGAMVPVTDAVPETAGNRSDAHRDGLEEWYLNGPLGVEQGFVMRETPACAGPKTITMAVDSELTATLDDADGDGRGNAIRFVDDEGHQALSYTDLFVTDATGKTIPAWLSVNAGELSIVVDDADAVYPLAIDPLIGVLQAKLLANDGATNDQFGAAVALSGDTAIVGARGDDSFQGSAYVFTRSNGVWTQQQKLTATDGAMGDWFGVSVALLGDTALVGAYRDDSGTNTDQGTAYVFTRSNGVWTQQQKLAATDGAMGDRFGESVALSLDTVLLGAPGDDDNGTDSGSAYVFLRNGTTWTQQAKLTAADGAASDFFGNSVALSGDTAIVGAHFDDVGANADQGSVYVFLRSGTVWTQQQKLNATDGAGGDLFGYSLALSGDTALVGAVSDDIGANPDQGSAYVFLRSGMVWTQQQKLTATGSAASDSFGVSVSLSGDTALVGAPIYDVGAIPDQGSACLFTRSGGIWTEQQKLTAVDGAMGDLFGI
ncbi:MAG TPA: FG-GAP repeat protein, partial [Polyangium sp.]|nr:FG-GAP repeat protein [Polyangium sp.]